jgi:hypothetical protein
VKALPRIEAARQKLISKLDALLNDSSLSERSRQRLETLRNAMRDHLKPSDLSGALRDKLEMPVRESGSGRIWNHEREVDNALKAFAEARESLNYEFKQSLRRAAARTDLSTATDEVFDFEKAIGLFLGGMP